MPFAAIVVSATVSPLSSADREIWSVGLQVVEYAVACVCATSGWALTSCG